MQSTSDMISMTSGANCGVVGGMDNLGWGMRPPRTESSAIPAAVEVIAGSGALGQPELAAPRDEHRESGQVPAQMLVPVSVPTPVPAQISEPALVPAPVATSVPAQQAVYEPGYGPAYGIDRTDEPARITDLIQHHDLDIALRDVRALPSSLPQLPALLGQLILALAQVGRHEDAAALASEMLARFPLRPEVTRTLIALAAILTVQGRFRQVFRHLGDTVLHTYAFSRAALGEWAQRLAYQFRRHGNPEAARCILGAWGNATAA